MTGTESYIRVHSLNPLIDASVNERSKSTDKSKRNTQIQEQSNSIKEKSNVENDLKLEDRWRETRIDEDDKSQAEAFAIRRVKQWKKKISHGRDGDWSDGINRTEPSCRSARSNRWKLNYIPGAMFAARVRYSPRIHVSWPSRVYLSSLIDPIFTTPRLQYTWIGTRGLARLFDHVPV